MQEWLRDSIEQICLADILAKSDDGFGRRFAMIAIDNSIEYAMICYVEVVKRLVGKHNINIGGIAKPEWESKKQHFEPVLSYVVTCEPNLAIHQADINRFHRVRNDLYHSGVPLTVSPSTVKEYSKIAKDCLNLLGGLNFGENEWNNQVVQVKKAFVDQSQKLEVKDVIVYTRAKETIKFATSEIPSAPMAIRIILHGFSLIEGRPPTNEELQMSLTLSSYTTTQSVIAVKVAQMRSKDLIHKGKLVLKDKAIRELNIKYSFRTE